jgi:hypothetical protein
MTTSTAPTSTLPPVVETAQDIAAQSVVVVYNCSRLGRTANPPRFSFSDWFRFGRRR